MSIKWKLGTIFIVGLLILFSFSLGVNFYIQKSNLENIYFLGAFFFILLGIGSFFYGFTLKKIIHPVNRLVEGTAAVSKDGDFTRRVEVLNASDEIGQLAGIINKMISRLHDTMVSKNYVDMIMISMVDMLIVMDDQEKIKMVNQSTCKALGYEYHELIGKEVRVLFSEDDGSCSYGVLKNKIQEGNVHDFRSCLKTRFGIDVPVSFSGGQIKDISGERGLKDDSIQTGLGESIFIARNIIEREKQDHLMNEITFFPQHNPAPLVKIDIYGKLLFVNKVFEDIFRGREWEGQFWSVFCPEFSLVYLERIVHFKEIVQHEAVLGKGDFQFTYVFNQENKQIYIYGVDIKRFKESEKKLENLIVLEKEKSQELERLNHDMKLKTMQLNKAQRASLNIMEDLDEAKKSVEKYSMDLEKMVEERTRHLNDAKQALELSKESFYNIVEKSVDGIIIVDKEGTVQFVNNTTRKLFGRKGEHLVGENFGFPFGDEESFELNIIGKEGKRGIGEMRIVDTEWDRSPASLISIRDITERKEIDRMKDEFLSTVSHEIRTPLVGVGGVITNILKGISGPVNEKLEYYLLMANRDIKRLDALVTDILDFSKFEKGMMAISKRPIDIPSIAQDVVRALETELNVKKLKVRMDHDENLPQCFADEDKIYQVFTNLIYNAIKFTPEEGEINVKIDFNGEGKRFKVAIEDTGIGISKGNIKNLFKRFVQIDRKEGGGPKGTGLGLAICKGIIELHQGEIWVESELNKGSKFIFTLPQEGEEPSKG